MKARERLDCLLLPSPPSSSTPNSPPFYQRLQRRPSSIAPTGAISRSSPVASPLAARRHLLSSSSPSSSGYHNDTSPTLDPNSLYYEDGGLIIGELVKSLSSMRMQLATLSQETAAVRKAMCYQDGVGHAGHAGRASPLLGSDLEKSIVVSKNGGGQQHSTLSYHGDSQQSLSTATSRCSLDASPEAAKRAMINNVMGTSYSWVKPLDCSTLGLDGDINGDRVDSEWGRDYAWQLETEWETVWERVKRNEMREVRGRKDRYERQQEQKLESRRGDDTEFSRGCVKNKCDGGEKTEDRFVLTEHIGSRRGRGGKNTSVRSKFPHFSTQQTLMSMQGEKEYDDLNFIFKENAYVNDFDGVRYPEIEGHRSMTKSRMGRVGNTKKLNGGKIDQTMKARNLDHAMFTAVSKHESENFHVDLSAGGRFSEHGRERTTKKFGLMSSSEDFIPDNKKKNGYQPQLSSSKLLSTEKFADLQGRGPQVRT